MKQLPRLRGRHRRADLPAMLAALDEAVEALDGRAAPALLDRAPGLDAVFECVKQFGPRETELPGFGRLHPQPPFRPCFAHHEHAVGRRARDAEQRLPTLLPDRRRRKRRRRRRQRGLQRGERRLQVDAHAASGEVDDDRTYSRVVKKVFQHETQPGLGLTGKHRIIQIDEGRQLASLARNPIHDRHAAPGA